jgi:ADP-ribosyl-[dinitrogen reductase] hydrolase
VDGNVSGLLRRRRTSGTAGRGRWSALACPRRVSPADLDDVRARARAAFLGLALGDALGATVEFMTPAEIRAAHGVHRDIVGGGWLRLRSGRVTDDTELSLCVARAIESADGWDPRAVAERFAAWLRAGPIDVGSTVRKGIRRVMLDGTLERPPNAGDAGNGAAMRMVPVALATLGDHALLERWTLDQARITHHHPLSDAACLHVGELVQLACLARSKAQLRRASDALVARGPAFRFDPYRGLATGYVVDTLQTVLHFFHSTRIFEACLVAVVNQGGDADTTGAYYGPEELPQRWLRRLDGAIRSEIEGLADRLVLRSPLSRAPGERAR